MKIEDTDPPLRDLAERIRSVAEWLTDQKVGFHANGWYKAGRPIFIYFKVVGPKGLKDENSVVVSAIMRDEKLEELADRVGNNNFGKPGYEKVVHVNRPKELAACLEFIGRAYRSRCKT